MNEWLKKNRGYNRLEHMPVRELVKHLKGEAHAGARDVIEGDFLAIGQKMVRSMKDLDFEGFMSVMGDDDGEELSEDDWLEQMRTVQSMVGDLGEVTVDELDPPDGAYLTFNAAEGALDVFMVLDTAGKVGDIRVTPKTEGHAGCATP